MILLDRVTKVYGKTHIALDRISLHVEPKEFVIIVGPSGAGKSTLLKLLTREERQSSGKIIVGGLDYENLRDRSIPTLRRRIGVVFQDFKLLPSKTVFENVAFALEIVGMSNQEIQHTVPPPISAPRPPIQRVADRLQRWPISKAHRSFLLPLQSPNEPLSKEPIATQSTFVRAPLPPRSAAHRQRAGSHRCGLREIHFRPTLP